MNNILQTFLCESERHVYEEAGKESIHNKVRLRHSLPFPRDFHTSDVVFSTTEIVTEMCWTNLQRFEIKYNCD